MANALQEENLTVTVAVGMGNKFEIGDLVCIHGLTCAVALPLRQASSIFVKTNLMRSMSDSCPLRKSCHGGMFLKAVTAKLSERVKATNGKPCLEAGLNRLPPTR